MNKYKKMSSLIGLTLMGGLAATIPFISTSCAGNGSKISMATWDEIKQYFNYSGGVMNGLKEDSAKTLQNFMASKSYNAIEFSSEINSIGVSAFWGCTAFTNNSSIKHISMLKVNFIGDFAFWGCTSLSSIDLGTTTVSVNSDAFVGCTNLTSISSSPNGAVVSSIALGAFEGCASLTTHIDASTVDSVGLGAFCGCTSLSSIDLGTTATSINEDAFWGCTNLTSISSSSNGAVISSLGQYSFRGCANLTTRLDLKTESTDSIGVGAFAGCSKLIKIDCPTSGLSSIGIGAFSGCMDLESEITIAKPDPFPNPTSPSIGLGAFWNCAVSSIDGLKITFSTDTNATATNYESLVGPMDNPTTGAISSMAFAGCADYGVFKARGSSSGDWTNFLNKTMAMNIDFNNGNWLFDKIITN